MVVAGLYVKYVRVTSKVLSPKEITEELHKVRSADEEEEILEAAQASRAEQLSLQPLYARPPPIWLHPAFAAEFADPFIADTPFEGALMHISLEVITLVLDAMLRDSATEAALSHAARSALNMANTHLKDTRKLAHKLAAASRGQGQELSYFHAVSKAFGELDPGGVVLLPWDGESPILLVIRRGAMPNHNTCTFTIVNPSITASEFHSAQATSSCKIKFQTFLELGNIAFEKLADEAWWAMLWYGMQVDPDEVVTGKFKRGPLQILYEVLLPALTGHSLERAMAKWESDVIEAGFEPLPASTLRRSDSGHYGCCKHALKYLLLSAGLDAAECRRASLMLRIQMFRFAQSDLKFVMEADDAERRVLHLALRQLAYKTAKLGSLNLIEHPQMATVFSEMSDMREALAHIAGASAEHAPPPLILCEADVHLFRPSLEVLLGPELLPPFCGEEVSPAEVLRGVEVLGLYFAASWCTPCSEVTPLIASAYKSLRARGKGLQIVLVPQDTSDEEFERFHSKMPWPSLPLGGLLPALLVQRYMVTGLPCLVLLDSTGALISTDGLRLLRRHTRSFPWSTSKPPETPHLHPLYDRMLRLNPVDPGQSFDLPKYKPLDYLAQPQSASTLAEAVSALRECDLLCTMTAVQSHSVLNTRFLNLALIQHTFTCVLPMPKPEGEGVGAILSPEQCLWRTPMLYDQQLGILLLLQRILEHFASSVLSVDHTRSIDGVRMVVPACIAAVADVVMRQLAVDKPSRVCLHLRGTHDRKGFTIGCANLARQSAEVVVHTPELNTARTCVLDYFTAQATLPQIYGWESS